MSDYPHTCACGSPCYQGLTTVKCSNPRCRHADPSAPLDGLAEIVRNLLKDQKQFIMLLPADQTLDLWSGSEFHHFEGESLKALQQEIRKHEQAP